MKETEPNKIWELATQKIHQEAGEETLNALEHLSREKEDEEIVRKAAEIHENLLKAKPLRKVSRKKSWERIRNHLARMKALRRRHLIRSLTKYAAIIFFAFLIGIAVNRGWEAYFAGKNPVFTEFKVPLGQMSELTLHDGTHVWLNSGTTLRYPDNFGRKERQVQLEGEAFFKVKESPKSFKVQIKNTEVEVLGTSFAVLSYPEDVFSKVTLVKGSVQINARSGNEIARLAPEEQIHIPEQPENYHIKNVNTLFYDSWIKGKIIFDDERLSEVTRRLERWYNVEIQFDQKETENLRFSGTILKNKPFDQIVEAFSLLLPVKIDYQNNIETKDVITISKNKLPMKD